MGVDFILQKKKHTDTQLLKWQWSYINYNLTTHASKHTRTPRAKALNVKICKRKKIFFSYRKRRISIAGFCFIKCLGLTLAVVFNPNEVNNVHMVVSPQWRRQVNVY